MEVTEAHLRTALSPAALSVLRGISCARTVCICPNCPALGTGGHGSRNILYSELAVRVPGVLTTDGRC